MMEPAKHPPGLRLLSIREGTCRMGMSRSSYYEQLKMPPLPGQPKLPRPIKRGCRSVIAEHELDAFIAALIHARDDQAGH